MTSSNIGQVWKLPKVREMTGLSSSTIRNKLNPASKYHDPDFPRPFKLTPGGAINTANAWYAQNIIDWIATRAAA